MKISVDTREDSHEDIRKVISMLKNLVGDNSEIMTNMPMSGSIDQPGAASSSPFNNIFGDTSTDNSTETSASQASEPSSESSVQNEAADSAPVSASEESSESKESTEDLFAELFSDEELKKMDIAKEEEEPQIKTAKKQKIEFY